jgi:hypothetical protein
LFYLQSIEDVDLLEILSSLDDVETRFNTGDQSGEGYTDKFSHYFNIVEVIHRTDDNFHFQMKSGNTVSVSSNAISLHTGDSKVLSPNEFYNGMFEVMFLADVLQAYADGKIQGEVPTAETLEEWAQQVVRFWAALPDPTEAEMEEAQLLSRVTSAAHRLGLNIVNLPGDAPRDPAIEAEVEARWAEKKAEMGYPDSMFDALEEAKERFGVDFEVQPLAP